MIPRRVMDIVCSGTSTGSSLRKTSAIHRNRRASPSFSCQVMSAATNRQGSKKSLLMTRALARPYRLGFGDPVAGSLGFVSCACYWSWSNVACHLGLGLGCAAANGFRAGFSTVQFLCLTGRSLIKNDRGSPTGVGSFLYFRRSGTISGFPGVRGEGYRPPPPTGCFCPGLARRMDSRARFTDLEAGEL